MRRENSRDTAPLYKTGLHATREVESIRQFRTEIKDRQLWSSQSLEELGNRIDVELERREKAASEAPKPLPLKESREKSNANDHLSFEEALRKEVEAFQQHYRSGVMSGR